MHTGSATNSDSTSTDMGAVVEEQLFAVVACVPSDTAITTAGKMLDAAMRGTAAGDLGATIVGPRKWAEVQACAAKYQSAFEDFVSRKAAALRQLSIAPGETAVVLNGHVFGAWRGMCPVRDELSPLLLCTWL